MEKTLERKRIFVIILSSTLILLSGCGSVTPIEPTTSQQESGEADITESLETEEPTTTNYETPSSSTTTIKYTRGMENEVTIHNMIESDVIVSVSITNNTTSTNIWNTSTPLHPDEFVEYDVEFPHKGEYEVRVQSGGNNATHHWDIRTKDPDSAISITIVDNGTIGINEVAI